MIVKNGHKWETLDDNMYVKGHKVIAVYAGSHLAYPIGNITFGVMNFSCSPPNAEQICVENGGHLASVHSNDENSFIRSCLNNSGIVGSAYIGGSDYESEGNWYWLDGSEWDYTNWSPGEPNNDHGQYYIQMYSNGKWDDCYGPTEYNYLLPFVCKWNGRINQSDVDERFDLYYYTARRR